MSHKRIEFDIRKKFPVGKEFLLYCQDGLSPDWGLWSAKVLSLDTRNETIKLEITQDWDGADTRMGRYWTGIREIKLKDFIIPILEVS